MHVLDLVKSYDGDLSKYNFADCSFIYKLSQEFIKKQFDKEEIDYHDSQNNELFLFALDVTTELLNELSLKNRIIFVPESDKLRQAENKSRKGESLLKVNTGKNRLEVLA